jgi:hypothetical protein
MSDFQKLEEDLKETRQEVHKLTVMAMWPNLSPEKAEPVRALERSARAEVRLRLKHLRWLRSQR